MSDRYPDDWWLSDFERRLADGRLISREEAIALILEARRLRAELTPLLAALADAGITISQHAHTPRLDEWFVSGPIESGPHTSREEAQAAAIQVLAERLEGARHDLEDLLATQERERMKDDGLVPWRRALDEEA